MVVNNKFSFFRNVRVKEEDITFLQGLSGCPLSYLATNPYKAVETGSGEQSVGSALAYQVCIFSLG